MSDLGAHSSAFADLLDYVESKTGGKRLARRSDINPTEIAPILPYLVILDIVPGEDEDDPPQDLIIRLMGTSVAANYGERTGQSIRSLPNKQAVERILDASDKTYKTAVAQGTFARELSDQRRYLQSLGLYIPLVDKDGQIVQILVVAVVTTGTE